MRGDTKDTADKRRLPDSVQSAFGSGRFRIGAVVAIAVAGGLLGWLLTRGGDHTASPPGPTVGQVLPGIPAGTHVGPNLMTAAGVSAMRLALHQPMYWIGPQKGYGYEVERTSNGNVFVTYLPPGVKSSGNRGAYVVIGTYPVANATDGLRKVAEKTNQKITVLPSGAVVLFTPKHPHSAYIAYPNSNIEVEIYAPGPLQARKLTLSGRLRPIR